MRNYDIYFQSKKIRQTQTSYIVAKSWSDKISQYNLLEGGILDSWIPMKKKTHDPHEQTDETRHVSSPSVACSSPGAPRSAPVPCAKPHGRRGAIDSVPMCPWNMARDRCSMIYHWNIIELTPWNMVYHVEYITHDSTWYSMNFPHGNTHIESRSSWPWNYSRAVAIQSVARRCWRGSRSDQGTGGSATKTTTMKPGDYLKLTGA